MTLTSRPGGRRKRPLPSSAPLPPLQHSKNLPVKGGGRGVRPLAGALGYTYTACPDYQVGGVILSAAKDLRAARREILRCAQDDNWRQDDRWRSE